jgi:PAS domain S-box-containing protein
MVRDPDPTSRKDDDRWTSLELLQRIARIGNWSLDPAVGVPEWSDGIYRIYERDPALGPFALADYRRLYSGESWDTFHGAITGAIERGESYDIELELELPSGRRKWVHAIGEPEQQRGPAGHRVHGTIQDVTERKLADEARRASEAKYRTLFATMAEGALWIRADGTTTDGNPAALEILGLTRDELLAGRMTCPDWCVEDEEGRPLAAADLPAARALRTGRPVHDAVLSVRRAADPEPVWLSINAIPRFEAGSAAPAEVFVTLHDITGRMRAELERRQLQERMARVQRLESVGRLAGGVAHDFNNMLNVILGNAELAMEQAGAEHPVHEHLNSIRAAAARSADLTGQLLAFASRQSIAPEVLDLDSTIAATSRILEKLLRPGISLDLRPASGGAHVRIDRTQLDQILTNLVVNARDAITGPGTITITTEPGPAGSVTITVGDDGCGMDADTLEHAVEPFFTTRDVAGGAGLGLATVFGIVQQCGGTIDLQSRPGEGTTVVVSLPQATGTAVAPAGEPDAPSHPSALPGPRKTILLVEDERDVLTLLKAMLEHLGYDVLAAESPREAIRMAARFEGEIAALVSDVVMPEMSGLELAERLDEFRPDLARLFLSGYSHDVLAGQGTQPADLNLLQKPVSRDDLARALQHLCSR